MDCCQGKYVKQSEELIESSDESTLSTEFTRSPTEDLSSKLCKELINELANDFYQSGSVNVLKMNDNSLRPSEIQLQGSAVDGFLIDFLNKSDVDFLYTMNVFTPSLKFKRLISDPRSPGHVKIEITPNISECKTDIEKEKLMTNIEDIDGRCFLNMQHIKQEICEQFYKRLNYCKVCQAAIKSEKNSCFRIQLDYDLYQVIPNYMGRLIGICNEFSESILKITELKENVQNLFSNLSGNYILNEFRWQTFKDKFNFNNEKNKTVQEEIINGLNYYLELIRDEMQELIVRDFRQWNFFTINEYCFYMLLMILINCGLDTIVEVVCDKIIILHQNNFVPENMSQYNDTIYFNEEEITKIINMDFNVILSEPITDQEKAIENIFYEFLEKIKIEFKNKIKDTNIGYNNPECSFVRMEDLSNGGQMDKLHWLSTIIKLLVHLLEYIKYCWSSKCFFQNVHLNQTIEIVPGLYFTDWPLIASDWVTRERYWPEPEIIQRIINNGYHMVFKSLNENNDYDGRLSFSEAETIMCQARTPDQIIIYNFMKCQIKSTGSKKLKSYYIKTLCFWVFESTSLDANSTNMQWTYLQDIIKNLCIALKKQTLQHYFIPQHNLFIELKNDDFDEINECLRKIDSKYYKVETERLLYSSTDHDISVSHFFRLVENLFFKSIAEIIK